MVLKIEYVEYNDFITENNLVLCLGYFDGMHIAHVDLIAHAQKIAKEKGLMLGVFTFSTNIKGYLENKRHRCLTTIEDKAEICKKYDVDFLYVIKVNQHVIHMEAKEFITRFLEDTNTIVIGYDFRFGYKGEGDRTLLKRNKNFDVVVIPQMKYLDLKVGSTRIKATLDNGNLDLSNQLLGRYYSIKGQVVSGRGIGRRLGYPTANIDYMPYWLPKSGVYFTYVLFNNKRYYGLTNIGNKPTYFNLPITVETYVFEVQEELYGKVIKVQFVEYLRPELTFETEALLSAQILNDIKFVEHKLKENLYEKI